MMLATCQEVSALAALSMVLREKREDLLELDARKRIFDHVQRYPGLHLSEVARACGIEPNHAKYHLEYLEARGIVASQKDAYYQRWYATVESSTGPRQEMSPREKALLAQLRRPVPLHVTLLLLDRESATHAELLPFVTVAHGTLHYHLANMQRAGILLSVKEGRERRYTLVERDALLRLLLRYKPPDALVHGFLDAWEGLSL